MIEHLEAIKWQPHDLMPSTYAWQQADFSLYFLLSQNGIRR